jgi:hypothetical protein
LPSENTGGHGRGCNNRPQLDNAGLVFASDGDADRLSADDPHIEKDCDTSTLIRGTSTLEENETIGLSCFWRQYKDAGISQEVLDIIKESWRESTRTQYSTYVKRWELYCCKQNVDMFHPTLNDVLQFLHELHRNNLSYSAMNTARSALSCFIVIDNVMVGQHHIVKRFMRGIFQMKPTCSRYNAIWDVNIVLDYFRSLSDNNDLCLKTLSFKIATLLAITSSQRIDSLYSLKLSNMNMKDDKVVFALGKVKQSRPTFKSMFISLHALENDVKVCVVKTLQDYLRRTCVIRGKCDRIFISYMKPHKEVTKSTIARWVRSALCMAGIDVTVFSAHSTRAASTSALKAKNVPLKDVMNKAGWTCEKTFAKHYDLPIEH